MDSRNVAAHSHRSDHEFRLEIHAADGVYLYPGGGSLAVRRPRPGCLALVVRRDRGCLHRIVDLTRHAKEIRAAHVSFRRMSTAPFVVLACLTLAAAVAAATDPKSTRLNSR